MARHPFGEQTRPAGRGRRQQRSESDHGSAVAVGSRVGGDKGRQRLDVVVEKDEHLAAGGRGAGIARLRDARRGQLDESQGIGKGERKGRGCRVVGAAVGHHNHLEAVVVTGLAGEGCSVRRRLAARLRVGTTTETSGAEPHVHASTGRHER